MSTVSAVIVTTTIEWEGRTIRLSYYPRRWDVIDHIELESENRTPLPVTETGYKSHFFAPVTPPYTADELISHTRNWLDEAARDPDWLAAEERRRQLSLF